MMLLLAALLFAAPAPKPAATATHVPTREDLDKIEELDHAVYKLRVDDALEEAASAQEDRDCLRAIGRVSFCDCLHENLSVGISFDQYVVSNTHRDADLSMIDAGLVKNARATRDKCAGK